MRGLETVWPPAGTQRPCADCQLLETRSAKQGTGPGSSARRTLHTAALYTVGPGCASLLLGGGGEEPLLCHTKQNRFRLASAMAASHAPPGSMLDACTARGSGRALWLQANTGGDRGQAPQCSSPHSPGTDAQHLHPCHMTGPCLVGPIGSPGPGLSLMLPLVSRRGSSKCPGQAPSLRLPWGTAFIA